MVGGPFSWDENVVEKGVDAVKGAGQELTNIATGLKTFQELVEKEIDFKPGGKLANAVTNSLSFVSTAFSAIDMPLPRTSAVPVPFCSELLLRFFTGVVVLNNSPAAGA